MPIDIKREQFHSHFPEGGINLCQRKNERTTERRGKKLNYKFVVVRKTNNLSDYSLGKKLSSVGFAMICHPNYIFFYYFICCECCV